MAPVNTAEENSFRKNQFRELNPNRDNGKPIVVARRRELDRCGLSPAYQPSALLKAWSLLLLMPDALKFDSPTRHRRAWPGDLMQVHRDGRVKPGHHALARELWPVRGP